MVTPWRSIRSQCRSGPGYLDVESPSGRGLDLREVATRGVHDTLGLAGRAGRIEYVEDVLRVHLLGRALLAGVFHQVVPELVAALRHVHVLTRTLRDDHTLYGGSVLEGLVSVGL